MNATPYYASPAKVMRQFDVSRAGLREWAQQDKIKYIRKPGGGYLYDMQSIYNLFEYGGQTQKPTKEKEEIIYARVSSSKQAKAGDLQRQVESLQGAYPNARVIKDIASGLNYKRKGLTSLLELAVQGHVCRVVVAHKDRLCRYGIELIEFLFKQTNVELVVHSKDLHEEETREQELAEDLLSIVNYFVAKNNGLRSARNKRRRALERSKVMEDSAISNVRAKASA